MSDNSSGITRVHYFPRQFLRTQDFTDEQAYHIAMRRRHNVAHHTWGIASGLEVVLADGNFYVQPGVAIDGYGRELVLSQKQPLNAKAFVDKGSRTLDVWLIYGLVSEDKPPAGYAGCGEPDAALFYRAQEAAHVELSKPSLVSTSRRQPDGVPAADLNFSPFRTPPDTALSSWPVFLGQIINDPTNTKQPVSVNAADRPYIGLVGESVIAPSGRARVQIGAERENDASRFAVFTRDERSSQQGDDTQLSDCPGLLPPPPDASGQQPAAIARLIIDKDGEVSIKNDASLYGNLTLAGGALEFEAGTARDPGATPWSIYRVSDAKGGVEELRIEMAGSAPGGLAGKNQVVVGSWFKGTDETGNPKEMFHSCLTISDDGTVTVHGNLKVEGSVKGNIEVRSRVEGQLNAAARGFATSAFMGGVIGAGGQLSGGSASALKGVAQPEPVLKIAKASAPNVGELADALAADDASLADFAERLRSSHPEAADRLRAALAGIITP